jgi:hypothetical protein
MNTLTLTYAGTERFLADWGVAAEGVTLRLLSRAVSTFTCTIAGGAPETAPILNVPFEAQVIIQINRTYSGGVFGGGSILFVGRRIDLNGRALPSGGSLQLVFADAWYDLEHLIFQHYWKMNPTAVEGGVPAASNFYFSRINLFQDIHEGPVADWSCLGVNAQISEIINYAAGVCGAPIQLGTVDPFYYLPVIGVKAVSCAEALQMCLRGVPDAVTVFDYTTSPPTLHIRQQGVLTWVTPGPLFGSVTLPYNGYDTPAPGHKRYHTSTEIKPRPDLQVSQVVLQYQQTNTVDDQSWLELFNDVYPPGATGQTLRALVCPIDLSGANVTYVHGKLSAQAINPATTAFWRQKKPDLADSTVTWDENLPVDPASVTVTDDQGNPVSLSGQNELLTGNVASWMTVANAGAVAITAVTVTIKANLKYKKVRADNPNVPSAQAAVHLASCRVKLTNSAAGIVKYSAITRIISPQTPPPAPAGGLALSQYLYNALNILQYEGRHVLAEDTIQQIVTTGMVLNLAGGAPAWTSMNAKITDVEIDFSHGKTTISFGPHKHLAASELVEILNLFRFRFVWMNPSVRNSGQANTNTDVTMGDDTNHENTNHAQPDNQLLAVGTTPDGSAHQTLVTLDAVNSSGQLVIQQVGAAGAQVAGSAMIQSRIADLPAGATAQYRQLAVCDSSGNSKTCYVDSTLPS